MKLSKTARVGFFAAAAATMGSVCVFHASHIGIKTPHIHVANLGDIPPEPLQNLPSQTGVSIAFGAIPTVQGMNLKAPLEAFEKAFNQQVDDQDKDRSNDYFFAAIADGAGAIAALVSVFIEASAVEDNPSEAKTDKADETDRDGRHERSPEDSSDRPDEETEATERDNKTTHKTLS